MPNCNIKFSKITNVLALSLIVFGITGPVFRFHKIYLFHISVFFFLITFAIDIFKENSLKSYIISLKNYKLIYFPLFITMYSICSLTWSSTPLEGLKKSIIISFSIPIVLAMDIIRENESSVQNLKKLLFLTGAMHLIVSNLNIFLHFYLPGTVNNDYLPEKLLGSLLDSVSRPTGFFGHPNNCALATLLFLPFILNLKNKFLSFILLFLSLIVILYANSRSIYFITLIYLIIESLYSLYFIILKRNFKPSFKILNILLSTLLASMLFYHNSSNRMFSRIFRIHKSSSYINPPKSINLKKSYNIPKAINRIDHSIGKRAVMLTEALTYWKSSPIFGTGIGSLSSKKLKIKKHVNNSMLEISLKTIHFYWIEILTELGVLALILYITWILVINSYFKFKIFSEINISIILFVIACPVLSSAVYFLPKWILFSLTAINKNNLQPFVQK